MEQKYAMGGRVFVLPFYLGFLMFFLRPMIQSITFVFNKVTVDVGEFGMSFVGLDNIKYIFLQDAKFSKNLGSALVQMLYQVPVILVAALFFAMILNQKFFGRVLARAILFLPVIIASGVVMSVINNDAFASSLISSSGSATSSLSQGLQELLMRVGLNEEIIGYFTWITDNMFSLLWRTGIQMIIFLAALQTIPSSLYEVSAIEGATAWENFWMITIPMIMPMIVVNIVYSIVDSFTDSGNLVMMQVMDESRQTHLSNVAAMSWIYTAVIFVILSVVMWVLSGMQRNRQIGGA